MDVKKFEKLPTKKKELIITKGIEVFSEFSFIDARTDLIVKEAGISKGLLFYYFGSKKNFYLYLLNYAVDLLTQNVGSAKEQTDFYEIIFEIMDMKYRLITGYPKETKFLNMASKETNYKVSKDIKNIFRIYHKKSKERSCQIISKAIKTLDLRQDIDPQILVTGLSLYIDAIVMKYLNGYQDNPMELFNQFQDFKKDIKKYLDLMIYGLVGK